MQRPYRSHLHPACLPCRKRKSRCKIEPHSPSCLMCRAHGTDCSFPTSRKPNLVQGKASSGAPSRQRLASKSTSHDPQIQTPNSLLDGYIACNDAGSSAVNVMWHGDDALRVHHDTHDYDSQGPQSTSLSIEDAEHENPHIISPAMTRDSQILTDYLSAMSSDGYGIRLIRPKSAGSSSRPILFTAVQKRPVGLTINPNPSYTKCQIIEKILEPWAEQLIDIYFRKANICFPLLNERWFRAQYATAKEKLSPALLSSVYAHSLVYWRSEPRLTKQKSPDTRFIWNLASEALQSELFFSPGISTIVASLLNIGGRPTTAMVGNGVRLGSAVSLAYSLGLNHDPLSWDISRSEKMLRMYVWWSLLIHDRWSSLAYGTPPHLQKAFYDVPQPKAEYQLNEANTPEHLQALSVFVALSELTEVLESLLEHLYQLNKYTGTLVGDPELRLNRWVEGLDGDVRQIIIRGTYLHIRGAANLRLAFLSVQLLAHRIQMERIRSKDVVDDDNLANRYINVQRTAEDIVFLVQGLQEEQLDDFWLPVSAFAFPSTVTFLLRCALESEKSPCGLAENGSVKLARDLIMALRRHRDCSNWDLGDFCLVQHAAVIEKLTMPVQASEGSAASPIYEDIIIPDDLFVNGIFGSFEGIF
ncbi:fungal-specific transcription factor domain-containing protein [Hypoxylon crocopeplum]|nr:fungal-specific transcription factor domain-containing protein [Hypoxylon crocopeplum]